MAALHLGLILNRPTMRALNNVVPEINYKVRRCRLDRSKPC